MSTIDKNLMKALENTFGKQGITGELVDKYINAIPYLLKNYSEKELHNPLFVNFMSRILDLLREYRFLEFLEEHRDSIEKYPGGEKTARRCLEEIFNERYKPGYFRAIDFIDTGQN